ncbi:MAG: SEL1-like repeat protein, partial [Rhodospirillaceae bacterium]
RARPLAPPLKPPRRNVAGYAATTIVLLGILAGGIWIFIELSAPDPVPGQREVASHAEQPDPAPGPPATGSVPAADAGLPDAMAGLPENVRVGLEMAKAGDAKAQHDVGLLHLAGRYFPRDAKEAARWFEAAAVQGLAAAQFNLGVLYGSGEGVEQNPQLAFFWFQSAAEQGEPRAQHNLATAYADGRGVGQSYDLALDWFTKAANAGLVQSQYSLGRLYETGSPEHRQDLAQARVWYEKAAAQGDGDAAERLAAISALATARKPIDRLESEPASVAAAPEATDSRPVTRAEIREVQQLLRRLNFDPGPADGLIGSRTTEAVKLFQRFASIETDGRVSRDLLEELRAVAGPVSNGG